MAEEDSLSVVEGASQGLLEAGGEVLKIILRNTFAEKKLILKHESQEIFVNQ
jgi:hypothetical protein